MLSMSVYGSANSAADTADEIVVRLFGQFTVAGSKALALQYYNQSTAAGSLALGVPSNSGEVEIYSEVHLWKIG
jgi:hypothetical protein